MKKKIILIMGLPGSGKTTLAKELKKIINASWLNADVIRKNTMILISPCKGLLEAGQENV